MPSPVHLAVEKGPDAGVLLSVPAEGARLGRSSKNDIILTDAALSRHHCRFFFKPGEGLWLADLGSSNATLVNDKPVQEVRLRVGDTVLIGDTVLRVVHDEAQPPAAEPLATSSLALFETRDLPPPRKSRLPFLLGGVAAVSLLAVAAWLPRILPRKAHAKTPTPVTLPEEDRTVEIEYEKIQASAQNVFRYALRISADRRISVQIDDLASDRHVRKEQPMKQEFISDLTQAILTAGFLSLDDEYLGIQPDVYDLWDLSVTIGRKTHRTRVVNRVEPDIFRNVRDRVEQCGKMELGLWAIQFTPEELKTKAREACLLAKKLYDEREIKYGNLASAIRSYREAEWYLETVEPKPDFYQDVISGMSQCKEEMQKRYDDLNFRAELAIRQRMWEDAAANLRIICETIPERDDARHAEARKKLLDVESRIQKQR